MFEVKTQVRGTETTASQQVQNTITANQPTNISLNLGNVDIVATAKQGNNLVLQLSNGQQLIIENYFVAGPNGLSSQLYVSQNGALQLVEVAQTQAGTIANVTYAGQAVTAANSGLVFATESVLAGAATGGLIAGAGLVPVVGGIGAAAVVAAVAGSSTSAVSDTTAPDAPVVAVATGTEISGTGEPGATIGVDTDGDGSPDLTTTVASDGTWSVTPSPVLADGTVLAVTATDAAGNESAADAVTVGEAVPVITTATGTEISGTGEAGSTIDVDTDGDGSPDLTTTVASDGTWSVTPSPALVDGAVVSAVQTDVSGNESAADVVTVGETAPVVTAASGTGISGTGEAGSTVDVDTDGDGSPDLTTTVASDGTWSVTPSPVLADGTVVSAVQTDADGNESAADTVTIGEVFPLITTAIGTEISGTGEAGATIGVDTDGDGSPDLTATVAPDGTWSVTPSPALVDGTVVSAVQTDADGNESATDVANIGEPTPAITKSSGTEISGTGEVGSTIGVDTDGDGSPDLTATVAPDGTWSVAPSPALADGTVVSAVQTDASGNESAAAVGAVDAMAPSAPVITTATAINDTSPEIMGTAEAGAVVMVGIDTDGDGVDDATYEVTADSSGAWSVDLNTASPVSGAAPSLPLSDGDTIDVSATATDSAGNVSGEATQEVLIDLAKFSVGDATIDEAAGTLTFLVSRAGDNTLTQEVNIGAFLGGSDNATGADFSGSNRILTFNPGETVKSYEVTITDDAIFEADETFTVQISNATNGALIADNKATGTITDASDAPVITFSDVSVDESGTVTFVATLSAVSPVDVTVDYAVNASSTATLADDFTSPPAATGTLTIPAGSSSVNLTLVVNDDTLVEDSEQLILDFSNAINASLGTTSATATILDNEPASEISLAGPVTVSEDGANLVFTLQRTGDTANAASVTVNTADDVAVAGEDYTALVGHVVNFAATDTTATFSVAITDDADVESNEAFNVTISDPVNATLGAVTTASGTILNDDVAAELTIAGSTATEGGLVEFTIVRSANTSGVTTVDYATSVGTAAADDFTADSGTITFAIGETTKTISIQTTDDALHENSESLSLSLSNASGGAILNTASATGNILDNDAEGIFAIDSITVNEADGTATFTVTRSGNTAGEGTVFFATDDGTGTAGTDYTGKSGSLVFAAGISTQTIVVDILTDGVVDGPKAFDVILSGAGAGHSISSDTGTANIIDAEATGALFSVSNVSVAEGDAGPATLTFTIERTGDTTGANEVDYNIGEIGDGSTANRNLDSDDFSDADGTALNTTSTAEGVAWESTVGAFTINSGAVDTSGSDWNGHAVVDTGSTDVLMSATISGQSLTTNSVPLFVVSHTDSNDQWVTVLNPNGRVYLYQITGDNVPVYKYNGWITPTGTYAEGVEHTWTISKSGGTLELFLDGNSLGSHTNSDLAASAATKHGIARVGHNTIVDDFSLPTSTAAGAVDYAANDPLAGTLSFLATETSKTVTIDVTGDQIEELDETIALILSNATNGATIVVESANGVITNDDLAARFSIADVTVNEDAGTITFTISRSGNTADAASVVVDTADGTATAGVDYTAIVGQTVNFAATSTSEQVTVTLADDTDVEENEALTLTLSGGSAGSVIDVDTATATIIDNDEPALLSIDSVTAIEGGNLVFTVTRSGNTAAISTVNYSFVDGTAAAGADFTGATGTLTFAATETSQTITVDTSAFDDAVYESTEDFTVVLDTPDATSQIVNGTGTGTITDNDAISELSINDVTVNEADGTATFTVTRTGDTSGTASADYELVVGNGTTLDKSVDSFTDVEGTALASHNPDSGNGWNVAGGNWSINANNQLQMTQSSYTSIATLDNGSVDATINVDVTTISTVTSWNVVGIFNADAATDSYYWAAMHPNGRIYLYKREGGVNTGISSAIFDSDGALNPETTYSWTLEKVGTDINWSVSASDGSVTTPSGTFSNALLGDLTYTEHGLMNISNYPVRDNFELLPVSGTAEATLVAGTVNFAATDDTQTITVNLVDDAVFEADETFNVVLSNPVGATLSDDTGLGTVQNDDAAPSFSIADVTVNENDGTAVLTVTISEAVPKAMTVDYALSGVNATSGADYTDSTGTVTIAAGQTTANIVIGVLNDDIFEGDEVFTVNLSNASDGALITTNSATVTIADNGDAAVFNIGSPNAVSEGTQMVFTVTRSGDSTQSATLEYSTVNGTALGGSDFTAATAQTVSFAAGATSAQIVIDTTTDAVFDANETFSVQISNPSAGSVGISTATGLIEDSFNPEWTITAQNDSVTEGGDITFVVTRSISSEAATIDFISAGDTATAGSDFTANSQTLSFVAGEVSKTVVVLTSDDADLEVTETVSGRLANAQYGTISTGEAIVSITDNEQVQWDIIISDPITVENVATSVGEDVGTVTFTITRTAGTTAETIDLVGLGSSAVAGEDFVNFDQTVSFAVGVLSQDITVTITDDVIFEANESFAASISNASVGTIETSSASLTIEDNESTIWSVEFTNAQPGVTSEVSEADGTASFTITRTGDTSVAADITVYTSGGSAQADVDYTSVNTVMSFAAGESSKTIDIAITEDFAEESSERINVYIADPTVGIVDTTSANVRILDNDGLQWFVSADDVTISEGAGTASFTVYRTGNLTSEVTVDFEALGNTATAGADFTATTQTLTFAVGESAKTVEIVLTDDALFESTESLRAVISNQSAGTLSTSTANMNITDDDLTHWAVSSVLSSVNEGAGQFAVEVTRSGDISAAQTIDVATADGSAIAGADYTAMDQTLSFAAGEVKKTLYISLTDDTDSEIAETILVSLSNPTSGVIDTATTTTTILASDDTFWSVAASGSADEGGVQTFVISRSGDIDQAASISYSTGDGTATSGLDYTLLTGTLSFAAGESSKSVTVQTIQDGLSEGDETLTLTIGNPTQGQTSTNDIATATISDDEIVYWTIFNNVGRSSREHVQSAAEEQFTVSRTGSADTEETISWAVGQGRFARGLDADDFGPGYVTKGSLTFAVGETVKTFGIPIAADSNVEANTDGDSGEYFGVGLYNPTKGIVLNPGSRDVGHSFAITSDDSAYLPYDIYSISLESSRPVEEGNTVVFNVSRAGSATSAATLNYVVDSGDMLAGRDFGNGSGVITFAAGQTIAQVEIPVLDNARADELSRSLSLIIEVPEGAGVANANTNGVYPLGPRYSNGYITEADGGTRATFAVEDITVDESAEIGNITITRSGDTSQEGTIDLAVIANSDPDLAAATRDVDFTLADQTVTFSAGQASRVIIFDVGQDTDFEGDETFTVKLSNASSGAITNGEIQVVISENDPDPAIPENVLSIQSSNSPGFLSDGLSGGGFYTVTRTGDVSEAATVKVDTSAGTAEEGVDYVGIHEIITLAPGESSKVVFLEIIADNIVDAALSETLSINLSNPSSGFAIGTGSVSVTLRDFEQAWDTNQYFSVTPAGGLSNGLSSDGQESTGVMAFQVTRPFNGGDGFGIGQNQTATVDWTIDLGVTNSITAGDLAAGQATSGTITFAAGEYYRTVFLELNQDAVAEADEAVRIELSNPSAGYAIHPTVTGRTLRLLDDDVLQGTSGNDVISGEYHLIDAGDGDDIINLAEVVGTYGGASNGYGLGSYGPGWTEIDAGAGNDVLNFSQGFDRVDPFGDVAGGQLIDGAHYKGGDGLDTANYSGDGELYDYTKLTTGGNLTGVEVLDMTSAGNQALALSLQDVLEMSDGNIVADLLRIEGNAGDELQMQVLGKTLSTAGAGTSITDVDGVTHTVSASAAGNADTNDVSINGQTYDVYQYTTGGTTVSLLVDTDITYSVI